MIGHCGVVACQRRSVSSVGQLDDAGAAEVHACSSPSSTKTRLQTISPGLLMPLSVPPPRRKYIGGWRSLLAPAQPPMKCAGGAAPRDQEDPDVIVAVPDRSTSPQRRSCSVFSDGLAHRAVQTR